MAALLLVLEPITGQAQSYFYSGPVSGYAEVDLTPGGFGTGGFAANFGTINETLNYDAVAQTLQEVGTVTLSPSSGTFNIYGSFFVPGTGSATLTVGNSGSISFDEIYNLAGNVGGSLSIPVSGSGVFQGAPFVGAWDIQIPMGVPQVYGANSTALIFSQFSSAGAAQGGLVVNGTDLEDATSDGTYYYSWSQTAVVATAVPEHGSMTLFGIGLSALAFFRRRGEPKPHRA